MCLKINEFLAPDQWPELLNRVPEGGPVTYPLFGGEGAAEFLAPFLPEDVCVGGAASLDASETHEEDVQDLGVGGAGAPDSQQDQVVMDAAFAMATLHDEHSLSAIAADSAVASRAWVHELLGRTDVQVSCACPLRVCVYQCLVANPHLLSTDFCLVLGMPGPQKRAPASCRRHDFASRGI